MSVGIGIVVQGFCPMGCGQTLRLSGGGEIICFGQDCPRPRAVTELLASNETEHLVWMKDARWVVRHPLWERVNGHLETCTLLEFVMYTMPPPEQSRRWRARKLGVGWELKPLAGNVA